MRKFLQRILTKPVINLANAISSRPDKTRVNKALSQLYEEITGDKNNRGLMLDYDQEKDKFIIFSDQHKGARDGADIFANAEKNYLNALDHYNKKGFYYICLGDSEELWENLFLTVKHHNKATFKKEKEFLDSQCFTKIFGNHDLYWDNDPLAASSLKSIYDETIKVYEGIILKVKNGGLEIYMTHGHQGDIQSDGNRFSKWFVSDIWGPFQAYLRINPNTPANNDQLKTAHNKIMYEWSANRKNTLLITGHTHQPVFRSLTQLELLYEKLGIAQKENKLTQAAELKTKIDALHLKKVRQPDFKGYLDTYFNTGCCCFDDGDITGIELSDGFIRLIKWKYGSDKQSERTVLEECRLKDLKLK